MKLPDGFLTAFYSRYLHHLPWRDVHLRGESPTNEQIVLVRGITGMRAPRHEFLALGYHVPPRWLDMNGDDFVDQGWLVTHWCEL